VRVARVWEWGGGEHDEEVGGAGAVAVQVVSESELVGMLFGKEEGRSGTACVRGLLHEGLLLSCASSRRIYECVCI